MIAHSAFIVVSRKLVGDATSSHEPFVVTDSIEENGADADEPLD
jgi:hypothetical protein